MACLEYCLTVKFLLFQSVMSWVFTKVVGLSRNANQMVRVTFTRSEVCVTLESLFLCHSVEQPTPSIAALSARKSPPSPGPCRSPKITYAHKNVALLSCSYMITEI